MQRAAPGSRPATCQLPGLRYTLGRLRSGHPEAPFGVIFRTLHSQLFLCALCQSLHWQIYLSHFKPRFSLKTETLGSKDSYNFFFQFLPSLNTTDSNKNTNIAIASVY